MRRDRITPGIILLLIGAAFLLRNFGYLHFHWSNIFHLWPIFLVIGGINLIFANNRSLWASVIKISVVIIGLGLVLFGDFGGRYNLFFPHMYFHGNHHRDKDDDMDDMDDNDNDDSDTTDTHGLIKVDGSSYYHAPYTAGIKIGKLTLSGGGTTFRLSDTTNDLFAADVKNSFTRYEMINNNSDSIGTVDFKMRNGNSHHFNWGDDGKSATATLKLSALPLWDIKVSAGATDLDFDLSKFKVRSIDLSGGAASFKVKVGEPTASNNDIRLSSGMADITVNVPKDAACSIVSSTGLSSNTFDGFTKTSDNHYETPGFSAAKNHIAIHISGGFSDFKVKRY